MREEPYFCTTKTSPLVTLPPEDKVALIRNYKAVYEHLWGIGWKEDDIIEELIKSYNSRGGDKGFSLRKQYSVKDLEYYFDGWWDYSKSLQNKVLWGLGFDNRQFEVAKLKGLFRDFENILQYGDILYCQERTDEGWCNTQAQGYSVASTDAVVMGGIHKWGYDFRKDLTQEERV